MCLIRRATIAAAWSLVSKSIEQLPCKKTRVQKAAKKNLLIYRMSGLGHESSVDFQPENPGRSDTGNKYSIVMLTESNIHLLRLG